MTTSNGHSREQVGRISMMKTRLVITIDLFEAEEETLVNEAKSICSALADTNCELIENTRVTLVRDGDRSALNLLLPKLEGRIGEHYQGRKASLKEVLE